MSRIATSVAVIGLGAVVVTGAGSAIAASGSHPLLRGKANHEIHSTSITNKGRGPALKLTARKGSAPLSVSNSTKVKHLNADEVDGLSASAFQRTIASTCNAGQAIQSVSSTGAVTCATLTASGFKRTVIVSPGTTATANGTELLAVVAAIPSPSATDPWLVKLEPGLYDLGSQTLTLRSGIDIEGSGTDVTTIEGTGGSGGHNVVVGVDDTEVRSLTINQLGLGDAYSPTGTESVRDVTLTGAETAIAAAAGTPALTVIDSTLDAPVAINDNLGRIQIRGSQITGSGMSTGSFLGAAELDIADSLVDVPAAGIQDTNSAPLACVGDYNAHYTALGTACT